MAYAPSGSDRNKDIFFIHRIASLPSSCFEQLGHETATRFKGMCSACNKRKDGGKFVKEKGDSCIQMK